MGGEDNALLNVAERISLDLDFEEETEEEEDLMSPSAPVEQDPSLLDLDEEEVWKIFEASTEVNLDAISAGSFEQLVPEHVRFQMAKDAAFATLAERDASDS